MPVKPEFVPFSRFGSISTGYLIALLEMGFHSLYILRLLIALKGKINRQLRLVPKHELIQREPSCLVLGSIISMH